jgi:hypothetical protein
VKRIPSTLLVSTAMISSACAAHRSDASAFTPATAVHDAPEPVKIVTVAQPSAICWPGNYIASNRPHPF